jgi:hypothetical protein
MDEQRRKHQVTTADIASTERRDDRRETDDPRGEREQDARLRERDDRERAHDVRRDDRREPHDHGEERDPRGARRDQPHDVNETRIALMVETEIRDLQGRWNVIQTKFVDVPREAVADADRLVAETIQRLAQSFAHGRATLEQQWDQGEDVSTEDLRQAFRRYRSFFDRLLAV